MKKFSLILVILLLLFSVAGCQDKTNLDYKNHKYQEDQFGLPPSDDVAIDNDKTVPVSDFLSFTDNYFCPPDELTEESVFATQLGYYKLSQIESVKLKNYLEKIAVSIYSFNNTSILTIDEKMQELSPYFRITNINDCIALPIFHDWYQFAKEYELTSRINKLDILSDNHVKAFYDSSNSLVYRARILLDLHLSSIQRDCDFFDDFQYFDGSNTLEIWCYIKIEADNDNPFSIVGYAESWVEKGESVMLINDSVVQYESKKVSILEKLNARFVDESLLDENEEKQVKSSLAKLVTIMYSGDSSASTYYQLLNPMLEQSFHRELESEMYFEKYVNELARINARLTLPYGTYFMQPEMYPPFTIEKYVTEDEKEIYLFWGFWFGRLEGNLEIIGDYGISNCIKNDTSVRSYCTYVLFEKIDKEFLICDFLTIETGEGEGNIESSDVQNITERDVIELDN